MINSNTLLTDREAHPRIIKYIGQKFGKLTVLEYAGYKLYGKKQQKFSYFKCECSCKSGRYTFVTPHDLKAKISTTCGKCEFKELIENLPNEEWKDYKGFKISNHGRVVGKSGYLICDKPLLNKRYYYTFEHNRVANVVYELFNSPIPKGLVINHIDGNKGNNHINNLEVCTIGENNQHGYDLGLHSPKKEISDETIHLVCKLIKQGLSNKEINEKVNISVSYINCIRNGTHRKDIQSSYVDENWFYKTEYFHYPREVIIGVLRDLFKNNMKPKEVAKKYKLREGHIYQIKCRDCWKTEKYEKMKRIACE